MPTFKPPVSPTSSPSAISRRQAIGRLAGFAGAAAVPMVLPGRVFGATAPSKQITLGFVGLGNEGYGHNLMAFLVENDARAVAVCDVFASRRKQARETVEKHYSATGCTEIADFRDVIARKDIDAVVISTPDHWHVPMSLMALEAGKDVFCEKPTLTIAEGRTLAESVARHKAVFQVGIEDRSVIYYYRMEELIRNGAIGQLKTIHVKLPAGAAFPIEQPAPVPAELNWDLWLGPAPFHPFTPTRTEAMHWRQVRDYSGGLLTDWGSHLLDTAQVCNFAEASGPVEVEGVGELPKNSMATTFVNYKLHYRYANGVEMFVESGGVAIRFDGTDGWVGNNGWCGPLEGTSKDLLRRKFPRAGNKIWPMPPNEQRNFLDCVKSRRPTTYTAEADQRLSTTMHVGNIAMTLGRKLRWDPQSESFPGDDAANALRSRPARDDWKKTHG
jgi:predicted dehydrogenase